MTNVLMTEFITINFGFCNFVYENYIVMFLLSKQKTSYILIKYSLNKIILNFNRKNYVFNKTILIMTKLYNTILDATSKGTYIHVY